MSPPPRDVGVTLVQEWKDGRIRSLQDYLAGEEPLQIRVGKYPLTVTMRTPGNDVELAAGFLFTEGLIQRPEQIISIGHASDGKAAERGNIIQAELTPDVTLDLESTQRNFFSSSSCGICGKASIESVRARGVRPPNLNFRLQAEILCRIPDALRSAQPIFGRTGGIHAAGLFDTSGKTLAEREDIGRHNAVDKIIGWALRENRLPLSDCILMVSGRGGFEIVQKAAMAGVPIVASVSACSSLAVQFAREVGMTLIGFLRDGRFVVYSGGERLGLANEDASLPAKP
ncbi:MAG TPA: formate dehydrogenase accessory sulfurtransferase FdhD [Candidatus Limnocylindrales bacterium]|nr:formate dehydrogenase accessory sulfurtransferase FdhD [Candidatus Limnocylindrales bacterium]